MATIPFVAIFYSGCMVMHDGRVMWSDLDSSTTQTVSEYVLLQDMQYVRAQATSLLQAQFLSSLSDKDAYYGGTSVVGSSRGSIVSVGQSYSSTASKRNANPDAELEVSLRRFANIFLRNSIAKLKHLFL